MEKAVLSVILPISSGGKYLEQSLDSWLSQTLEGVEVVYVKGDGCAPQVEQVLACRQKDHPRLQVVTGGRQAGLEATTGRYVLLAGPDDVAAPQLAARVQAQGDQYQADVVVLGDAWGQSGGQGACGPQVIPGELPGVLFSAGALSPWAVAVRRSYGEANGLFDLLQGEGLGFALCALALARSISWVEAGLVSHGTRWAEQPPTPGAFLRELALGVSTIRRQGALAPVQGKVAALLAREVVQRCAQEENLWDIQALLGALRDQRALVEELLAGWEPRSRGAQTQAHRVGTLLELSQSLASPKTEERGYTVVRPARARDYRVSVIIPVYQVEDYLEACLDSVVGQSLEEIEIICVNDGSPDGSLALVEAYAVRDDRIVVICQENQGLSQARNHGMAVATGKYLYFLDGDDVLERNALEELYTRAEELDLTAVYFDANCFSQEEELRGAYLQKRVDTYHRRGSYPQRCPGGEMLMRMERQRELYVPVWLQLIRRDYALGFSFVPGIYHEDNPYTVLTMALAPQVGYVHRCYVWRRYRSGSITTQRQEFRHCYGYFRGYEEIWRNIHRFSHLSQEQQGSILHFAAYLRRTAVNIYANLTWEERVRSWVLPLEEAVEFACAVGSQGEERDQRWQLREQVRRQAPWEGQLRQARQEVERLQAQNQVQARRIQALEEWARALSRPGLKGLAQLSLGWAKEKLGRRQAVKK